MELKEKPKWYEWYICKVWRANYAMNQNSSQKMFALSWGLKTKYVKKPHYCSFSDDAHKAVQKFQKKKESGELGKPVVFNSFDDFLKQKVSK